MSQEAYENACKDVIAAEALLEILEEQRDYKLFALCKIIQNLENYILTKPTILYTSYTEAISIINSIKQEIIQKYSFVRF